jgi:hypothetical protein
VLSRGKVTPATVSYYTDEVAPGLEDYYAGRGEAVGHWVGHGSSARGTFRRGLARPAGTAVPSRPP